MRDNLKSIFSIIIIFNFLVLLKFFSLFSTFHVCFTRSFHICLIYHFFLFITISKLNRVLINNINIFYIFNHILNSLLSNNGIGNPYLFQILASLTMIIHDLLQSVIINMLITRNLQIFQIIAILTWNQPLDSFWGDGKSFQVKIL